MTFAPPRAGTGSLFRSSLLTSLGHAPPSLPPLAGTGSLFRSRGYSVPEESATNGRRSDPTDNATDQATDQATDGRMPLTQTRDSRSVSFASGDAPPSLQAVEGGGGGPGEAARISGSRLVSDDV